MTANCSKDKKLNFYEGVTKIGHILFFEPLLDFDWFHL
ncbi:hypothetical protein CUZ89_0492 [Enterococcus xinjiangensis]|nr:hypothetical protein [Enterococcus lactis]MBL4990549.1 hypothetical protein [Enterococcus lactis]MBL4994604.1 hypothetical protein [Enterococcus lactis]MBL5002311.1 hypothetical protein [Enterococcus lactis]MBL5008071.1 hypothetical protein [Enterococcus lactis]